MKQEFIDEKKALPTKDRSCTDIICLLLFACGIIALYTLFGIGLQYGRPSMIFTVWDSSRSPCGIEGIENFTMKDYKYLYFPSPFGSQFLKKTVCVKECPTSNDTALWNETNCNLKNNENVTTCKPNKCNDPLINPNDTSIFCLYKTEVLFNRICRPSDEFLNETDIIKQASEIFNKYAKTDFLSESFQNIEETWKIVLSGLGIAFVVSFFYMFFTRYFAGFLIWISLLLYFSAIIALGVLCFTQSIKYRDAGDEDHQKSMEIIAYICWAIAGLSFLILLCTINRIKLAIAIIKTATQYISDVPFSLLVPVLFTIICGILWVVYIVGFVYLYSYYDTIRKSDNTPFAYLTHNKNQQAMLWVFIFLCLWLNEFVQAKSQFILASSVSIWYFNRENLGSPIWKSFCWSVTHWGSLAFGSLLLALVKFVKIVVAVLVEEAKKAGGEGSQLIVCVLHCLQCLIDCFEQTIKIISKNAYVMISLKGEGFITAAREAYYLLWNNSSRAILVNGLGQIYIFIGQIFISVATTLIVYLILTQVDVYKTLNPFLPCLLVFLIALTVAILFLSVYGMGIDAIFLCFCYDESLHNGGKHCPPLLKDFLEDNVKK